MKRIKNQSNIKYKVDLFIPHAFIKPSFLMFVDAKYQQMFAGIKNSILRNYENRS
jgi:hypothetical protein